MCVGVCQALTKNLFREFQLLTIFENNSTFDIWMGVEYNSEKLAIIYYNNTA